MNILGIIPARAGSKGIKDKNIYPLCGKPLTEWTTITETMEIDDVVITTDIKKYYGRYYVHKRPKYLCQDDTPMMEVIKDAISYCERKNNLYVDAVILLQPTSPLKTHDDIKNAIKLFKESNANSLYSGYYMGIKNKSKIYDKHTSEKHFQRNGAIFIAKRELIEQGKLWDDDVIEFEMPLSRSIDIDTMDDMYIAEALLEKRLKEVKNP